MKKCPKCGCTRFVVSQHIVQSIVVDGNGEYLATVSECDTVTHSADNNDIWECEKCGYTAAGSEFEVN